MQVRGAGIGWSDRAARGYDEWPWERVGLGRGVSPYLVGIGYDEEAVSLPPCLNFVPGISAL